MSAMPTPLRLDAGRCDGCGRCRTVCGQGALRVGASYIYVDWDRCDDCGRCVDACDRGAIVSRDATRPVSLSSALVSAAAARERARPDAAVPVADPPASSPAWSLADALLVVSVAFALLIGVQAFLRPASSQSGTAGLVLLAYDIALGVPAVLLALRRGSRPVVAFRLDRAGEWHSWLLAVGLFVGARVLAAAYQIATVAAGFGPSASEGPTLDRVFGAGPLAALTTVLVVGIAGPLVEEIAVRGIVLGALSGRFGPTAGVFGSAVLFSLLHASIWSFVPLTVLGLALGWLAVRSRSLWPAIALHMAYNLVLVTSALYVTARG